MRKQLEKVQGIRPLSRNTKLQSEGIYLLSSESAAQSVYFETKRDIIRAHKLMNKHLQHCMGIMDYLFTSDGWILVVETKSSKAIIEAVKKRGYKSDKMKGAIKSKDISIIISELIRYVISGIARITNSRANRLGALVRRNFSRYVFRSMENVEKIMKLMKKEQVMLCHQRKRYRPSIKWRKALQGLAGKGDVYLCTEKYGKVGEMGRLGVIVLRVRGLKIDVLRKAIESTKTKHPFHNPSLQI